MEATVYKNNIKLLIFWRSKLQSGEPKRWWCRIHPRDQRSSTWVEGNDQPKPCPRLPWSERQPHQGLWIWRPHRWQQWNWRIGRCRSHLTCRSERNPRSEPSWRIHRDTLRDHQPIWWLKSRWQSTKCKSGRSHSSATTNSIIQWTGPNFSQGQTWAYNNQDCRRGWRQRQWRKHTLLSQQRHRRRRRQQQRHWQLGW